ncbi:MULTISPECIES: MipA/OmpV family protein [Pseudomonas]|uniref:MipA/OmpV family protein n=1 Tax=Pseudomonas TaxID=286 RepID=UPI000C154E4F|nr:MULTISPECIES: MipA/OmpV family protein [Pseudomonas]MBD8236061.1 MipA/OmpV family protein [Pseudomonas fluorescens]MCM2362657.1 MipA/OmpV family protein [Pseudomonas sp. SR18]MDY0894715.1 MipA/OmpV family protein [Pseudomonas fluorescens]PIB62119.1 structural protein MipA [Pseudomonas sp. 2822-17]
MSLITPPTRAALWGAAALMSCTLAPQAQAADTTTATLGLGMGVTPRFMGADRYRALVLPMFSIQRGVLFADSTRGLGVQFQSDSGFAASAAINYDLGRKEKDSTSRPGGRELNGMGDVNGATVADFTLSQQLLDWLSVSGEAELRMAGEHRGNRYRFGLEGILFHTDSDTLALDLDAHAGDGRYNQTYFGVTQAQSQRSLYGKYSADAGIYAYSAALNWQHSLDAHWSTLVSLTLTQYADQARNSPLVLRESAGLGLFAINYTF